MEEFKIEYLTYSSDIMTKNIVASSKEEAMKKFNTETFDVNPETDYWPRFVEDTPVQS